MVIPCPYLTRPNLTHWNNITYVPRQEWLSLIYNSQYVWISLHLNNTLFPVTWNITVGFNAKIRGVRAFLTASRFTQVTKSPGPDLWSSNHNLILWFWDPTSKWFKLLVDLAHRLVSMTQESRVLSMQCLLIAGWHCHVFCFPDDLFTVGLSINNQTDWVGIHINFGSRDSVRYTQV